VQYALLLGIFGPMDGAHAEGQKRLGDNIRLPNEAVNRLFGGRC
jgi:hypothetical protein